MKKNVLLRGVFLLLMSSCASSNQMSGTFAGASLGGVFGSAIGGLMGGPRGSDAGTAIGMIVGGAAGAAATAPRSGSSDDYSDDGFRKRDNYDYSRKEKQRSSSRGDEERYYTYRPSQIEGLQIENIRFVDENHDQVLQPNERAKIVFNVYNRGNQPLYNITPLISVNKKQVMVSPAAIISSLAPGKGCVYTASLLTSPRLREGSASFVIAFKDGDRDVVFKTFEIATRRP